MKEPVGKDLLLVDSRHGEPSAPVLVMLHGLLGSSRNWLSLAQRLEPSFHVVLPDLRNHGKSPWHGDAGYDAMEVDLVRLLRSLEQGRGVFLAGHSLGGKVAMRVACRHPGLVRRLVVIDIMPRRNPPAHDHELTALLELPLDQIQTRKEAESWLETSIPSWGMRQFLLTNLARDGQGRFRWAANLPVLLRHLRTFEMNPLETGDSYQGPVLFVFGGKSNYYSDSDRPALESHFPLAEIVHLKNSGHNPHMDDPGTLLQLLEEFLANPDGHREKQA